MAQDFGDDMGSALLNFVTRQAENYLRFGRGRERAFDWWQRHYKKEGNTPEAAKAMAEKQALKEKLDGRDLHFETTVSKKQENPPLPYNLTVLLSDMSERFGFTAAETQQITQDLRDKYKAITYNRSDSQYLKVP